MLLPEYKIVNEGEEGACVISQLFLFFAPMQITFD